MLTSIARKCFLLEESRGGPVTVTLVIDQVTLAPHLLKNFHKFYVSLDK